MSASFAVRSVPVVTKATRAATSPSRGSVAGNVLRYLVFLGLRHRLASHGNTGRGARCSMFFSAAGSEARPALLTY